MMEDERPSGPQGTQFPGALSSYAPGGAAGDRVLIHPSRPRWLVGNPTSERIARDLAAPGGSVEAAAAALAADFGLSLAEARRDVLLVQDQLTHHGMLDGAEPEAREVPCFGFMFLMLTERCNLACAHCWGAFPARQELPLKTVLRIVDELVAGGGNFLVLSGGEPLLYPGLKTVLERVGRQLPVQICSNGILIDEGWARYLAESGLDIRVQISLDGPTAAVHDAIRGPGTFEGALRGIRNLQAAGLGDKLIIASTIQGLNHRLMPEIIQLAADLRVPRLRLLPLKKKGRALETLDCTGEGLDVPTYEAIFDRVLQVPSIMPKHVNVSCGLNGFSLMPDGERGGCTVGSQLVITPTGEVYPCVSLIRPDCWIGNVNGSSLQAIVDGARMAELHAAKLTRKDTIPACKACQWQNLCQSGCMAEALEETGTLWDVDSMCDYRQRAYARVFDVILGGAGPVPGRL